MVQTTEFDGWIKFDCSIECFGESIDGSTLCDDRATPIPNEAQVKTSDIQLQSVVFVKPNIKHSNLIQIFGWRSIVYLAMRDENDDDPV